MKTQKELAFLRDLYVQEAWTRRFTDLVDKHMDLSDSENMLYINAGTGGHAMAIFDRFGEKIDVFATAENADLLAIANDKAAAVRSGVDFSMIRFEDDAFDAVLADGTFVPPSEIESLIENTVRVARTGGDIAIFLPTAGSFGEIFSILWEALFNEGLADSSIVEELISGLPTVSRIEAAAADVGVVNINTQVSLEGFEFENAAEFIESPLVGDFLLPAWLAPLDEDEKDRVEKALAALIDAEEDKLTFRFSVKATLLTGERG